MVHLGSRDTHRAHLLRMMESIYHTLLCSARARYQPIELLAYYSQYSFKTLPRQDDK
jgi:hypothetical protein